MSAFPRYYILLDRLPVAVDMWTWARQFEKSNRKIASDRVGKARVSTVFLGLDHSFSGGEPVLFETTVFGGPLNGEMDRYSTYSDAERGHQEMLTKVKIASARIKVIADDAGAKQ